MDLDAQKIELLRSRPVSPAAFGELRRQDQVFFVGAGLPTRPTLETIFESDCLAPVDLFWLDFADEETFLGAEELVRQIKKNFRGFVLGRFELPPANSLIDRAYAAGLDLLEIPAGARSESPDDHRRLAALVHGCSVFPRWAVVGSLPVCTESLTLGENLLNEGIVPLLTLEGLPRDFSVEAAARAYRELAESWDRHKVALKPLRPLIELVTPLVTPPRPRGIARLVDKVDDARLRTASDLRRLLRVREVEASFESAGL